MKKLLLFTFLILSNLACAQGNLQFNQVQLVTSLETVPVGKVWKIESVIYNIALTASGYQSTNGGCNSPNYYESTAIEIAGTPTKVGHGTQPASVTVIMRLVYLDLL